MHDVPGSQTSFFFTLNFNLAIVYKKMEEVKSILRLLIPLLIIMDPVGNLPFFLMFTKDNTSSEKIKIAALSCITAAVILIIFAFSGDFLLRLFGISIRSFQIAGGFIFFMYAIQMLGLIPSGMKTSSEEEKEGEEKESAAFVPLGTPLLAGPGAITAVLVWQNQPMYHTDPISLLIAILCACGITFFVFCFAQKIADFLGVGGIRVITRIMGLLLSVIAVEFMVRGFSKLC